MGLGGGRGGSADFIFMGAGIFLIKIHNEKSSRDVAGELPGKWGEIVGSPGSLQKLRQSLTLPPSDTPNLSPTIGVHSKEAAGHVNRRAPDNTRKQ